MSLKPLPVLASGSAAPPLELPVAPLDEPAPLLPTLPLELEELPLLDPDDELLPAPLLDPEELPPWPPLLDPDEPLLEPVPLLDPELPELEPPLDPLLEPVPASAGSSTMWMYRMAVKVSPSYAMFALDPEHVTSLVNSCAYGVEELQPGSSMKTAFVPGVTHFSKSTMCPEFGSRLAASPGFMSAHWMTVDALVSYGANVPVTRPGAGSSHAHEMKPEQSERYGSHCAFDWRMHTDEHAVSPSGCPLALWQYCSLAVTHSIALAIACERVTGPDVAADSTDVFSGSVGRGASGGAAAEQPTARVAARARGHERIAESTDTRRNEEGIIKGHHCPSRANLASVVFPGIAGLSDVCALVRPSPIAREARGLARSS